MPYENCEDCKKCLPCPVTSGNKKEGAYPIVKQSGNIWYCTSCFYCDDVCPEISPREYAIEQRRRTEQESKIMREPLEKIRSFGSIFNINNSINELRVDSGLPVMLQPEIQEINTLFDIILDSETEARTKPKISPKKKPSTVIDRKTASIALFLGCLIPYRVHDYEISARNILKKLEINYLDLPFTCCGSVMCESQSEELWLTIASYNLALAEQSGVKTIITLCGGCAGNLRRINNILQGDKTKLEFVNNFLKKINKKYTGTITIKHFTEFLREVNYKEKIEKLLDHHKNEKLSKLSVGMQIPCQIIRPEKDSPNAFLETKLIEDLLKTTSIKIVHYPYELLCCGSSMLQYDEQIAYEIAKKRINSLLQKGVDAVVLGCGNCSMNYNIHQKEYSSKRLPTLFFTEILDFATGGLNNKINEILKKKNQL